MKDVYDWVENEKSGTPREPHEYPYSRASVHMDGSCNGLQHYAALGRDAEGARAVNVVMDEADLVDPEGALPHDVYSIVLREVVRKVEAQAAELPRGENLLNPFKSSSSVEGGLEGESDARLAQLCLEYPSILKRSTVKQTVVNEGLW